MLIESVFDVGVVMRPTFKKKCQQVVQQRASNSLLNASAVGSRKLALVDTFLLLRDGPAHCLSGATRENVLSSSFVSLVSLTSGSRSRGI